MLSKKLIIDFIKYCDHYGWYFDNHSSEFTFQFRFGWFLNSISSNQYLIDFETNVKKKFEIRDTCKTELDIYVYDKMHNTNNGIEIKYIKDKMGYDISLYKMCEDIKFLEELQATNIFTTTYSVAFTSIQNSFTPPKNGKYKASGERLEFYRNFRERHFIPKAIYRNNKQQLTLRNEYKIEWIDFNESIKVCLIEVVKS